jgi:C4-dicarboxylate-specific signal transduction histidine kinase
MNLEALTESIAHEVRQPLTSIAANGSAALRLVERSPPDLEEVRLALADMIRDGARIEQLLDDIRVLFGKAKRDKERIDINHAVLEALKLLQETLRVQGVASHVELEPNLPLIAGHKGQLQEVFINLVQDAVDAMGSIANSPRVLTIRTLHRSSDIVVEVEDSGPGVDPLRSSNVFDAFITTKPHGTGLGLTICRMIVERHGGSISRL